MSCLLELSCDGPCVCLGCLETEYWPWFPIIPFAPRCQILCLRPPHTSRFYVGRQKIFTCRLLCGEFRQVCDKIGACRAKSDSDRSQNFFVGPCRLSVRWTKTICRRSRAAQPIRKCHESHESGKGAILIWNDPTPRVLTIYTEKPEIPVRKWNGTSSSVRNVPEKVGGRLRRSIFPALFGFPGWCANHFNFPLFSRVFTQDKTKWRKMRETKVSLKTA